MVRAAVALSMAVALSGAAEAADLVNQSDRDFVATVNQQCLFAAKLGGAASGKAASVTVRTDAAATAARQAQLCAALKRIADKWQIGTPGTLERPFSQEFDRVVGLSGPAFDQDYRTAQSRAVDIMARAAANEVKSGANPDLRTFASGPLAEATRSGSTVDQSGP